jgi:glutathione S-transferase
MPADLLLIDLAFSAWSEKVRWALDWKGVAHHRREYLPMIGDRELRRLSGGEEVPVLVLEGGRAIADSTRIVLHLEEAHPEPALLPRDARARAEVMRWQDWAGEVLSPCARVLVGEAIATDREAARATVSPHAPAFVRFFAPLAVPIGVRRFCASYEITPASIERARWRLPILLGEVEAALASGKKFLVGDAFTLADLAVASALAIVTPPADEWLPRAMPPALRRAFTLAEATRYAPLLAWRDDLYRRFRKPARAPAPEVAAAK